MTPTFFAKQSDFRNWLEKKHKKETALIALKYPMNIMVSMVEKMLAKDMDISLSTLKNIPGK